MLKTLIMKATFIALVGSVSFAAHAVADTQRIEIPAGDLVTALESLAKQAEVDLVYSDAQVRGLRTAGVSGDMSAHEAIAKLLEGTPLEVRADEVSGALLIAPPPVRPPANTQPAEGGEDVPNTKTEASKQHSQAVDGVQKKSFWDRFRVAQFDQTKVASDGSVEKSEKAPERGDVEKLEEITVTAQKRLERAQDVPISISVLTGQDLDQSTVQGVTEALNTVPGVTAQESYIGGGTQISVRGVSGSSPILHGSSPIAYYLDSVPFGLIKTSIAPDANAYDMQRVEVLRGPQGTLYGASALNGVVRVLTQDADLGAFEFKARTSISSTEGGDGNYRADAALNLPLVADKLAIRAVAGYQNLSGWIEKPNAKNVNSAELRNIRFKVNAQPTDALSIGFSTWFSRDDRDSPPQAQENDFHAIAGKEPQSSDYDVYALTVGYDFSPITVTSFSSYLRYKNSGILRMDEIGVIGAQFVNRYSAEVLSEELNLHSKSAGPWRWTIGGLYRDEKDRTSQDFPGIEAFLGPFDFDDTSKSFAAYGEITRVLLDRRLELTAGLRYFEDDVGTRENRLPAFAAAPLIHRKSSFDKVSPRVVLTWLPNEDLTVYASYSEGFRSGSQQQPGVIRAAPQIPSLGADSLSNYEVGSKGNWGSGLFSYEAAVYYIDWSDVQTDSSILVAGLPQAALINGDSASGVGFDLSVSLRPTERWELGLAFGRNNLAYDSDVFLAGVPTPLFSEGSRLSMSPRTSAGGFLNYTFPFGGGSYTGALGVSANYSSSQFIKIPGGVGQGDSILIARSSFTVSAPSNWELSLYADNVTNEDNAIQRAPFFNAPDWTVRPRPRTIGLQIEYRY